MEKGNRKLNVYYVNDLHCFPKFESNIATNNTDRNIFPDVSEIILSQSIQKSRVWPFVFCFVISISIDSLVLCTPGKSHGFWPYLMARTLSSLYEMPQNLYISSVSTPRKCHCYFLVQWLLSGTFNKYCSCSLHFKMINASPGGCIHQFLCNTSLLKCDITF